MAYMKISTIYAFVAIGMLAACTSPQKEENTENKILPQKQTATADSTVVKFLIWYRSNGLKLNHNMVLNNGDNIDNTVKNYRVDFPATELYIKELMRSGLLSEKFANNRRAYFKKCDDHFISHPNNEGPPEGFDHDLITFSQEDPGLNELHKMQIKILKSDDKTAQVGISFPHTGYHYIYHLSKDGDNWLIDDIQPLRE